MSASESPKRKEVYEFGHFDQDFFAIWKDADPAIPIYKQATAEYAKVQ